MIAFHMNEEVCSTLAGKENIKIQVFLGDAYLYIYIYRYNYLYIYNIHWYSSMYCNTFISNFTSLNADSPKANFTPCSISQGGRFGAPRCTASSRGGGGQRRNPQFCMGSIRTSPTNNKGSTGMQD